MRFRILRSFSRRAITAYRHRGALFGTVSLRRFIAQEWRTARNDSTARRSSASLRSRCMRSLQSAQTLRYLPGEAKVNPSLGFGREHEKQYDSRPG